jgi:hypothetical protein
MEIMKYKINVVLKNKNIIKMEKEQHLYHTYYYTEEQKEKKRLSNMKRRVDIEKRGYPMRPKIHRTPEEMKERARARVKEYYQKNKSEILEKARQNHVEKSAYDREYYQKNRSKILEYYQKNRSKILEKARQKYHEQT